MIRNSIPSVFTIGNLLLGVISILLVFNGQSDLAAILVIVAMLLDGLDGRVARAMNAQSEFGKELDSLSDVISFGLAPTMIMYYVIFKDTYTFSLITSVVITAIFPVCGAIRLARFNVGAATPGYFIGLPIPAAGGILATLMLFAKDMPSYALLMASLLLSYLMISRVKYPNFKKVAIPKAAIWVIPLIVFVAVILAVRFPGPLSKMMLVPLVIYALFGLKKNVDRMMLRLRKRRRHKREEKASWESRL